MRYASIRKMDISNGDGIGISLFVQGCHLHCPNCFNKETWSFDGGKAWTEDVRNKFVKMATCDHIKRVSILGGEPLSIENLDDVYSLVKDIKKVVPKKYIWIYTGYTWEEIMFPITFGCMDGNNDWIFTRQKIISECDVLVDGEYNHSLKDDNYPWAGSTNQRVIDIQKSIKEKSIVLYE